MAETLVIVESPTKAKAIGKFLGSGYRVMASMGHVRDLPEKKLGIDTANGFTPTYEISKGKTETVRNLKAAAKAATAVLLASDPDREGEAISWHLAAILGINPGSLCRVTFHEITRGTVLASIRKPRAIDMGLVDAQSARRILDRLVGYEVSPVLWRKVQRNLSAGRVQSAALRILCDREKEISAFRKEEFWTVTATLKGDKKRLFKAVYTGENGKKRKLTCEQDASDIVNAVRDAVFKLDSITSEEKKTHPAPPFRTSTLQQEASRKLGFPAKKTMKVAQELFEGIDLGNGHTGLITYHRTDSARIAIEAQNAARKLIAELFGSEYVPEKPNFYKTGKNAQDGHEAIRPTDVNNTPDKVASHLTADQLKLYCLIWNRFIACQMAMSLSKETTALFKANGHDFVSKGSVLLFKGFMAVYTEGKDVEDEKQQTLPEMKQGDSFKADKLVPEQHFTSPPSRYTEASLVKTLEEKGIGRPSTYATILSVLSDRHYVDHEKKSLIPTPVGMSVNEFLCAQFPNIVDTAFTAHMEEQLDNIEKGQESLLSVLTGFYGPFEESVKKAGGAEHVHVAEAVSETPCPKCGALMVVKNGKFGKFLACPNYPDCKTSLPITEDTGIKCPKCGGRVLKKHGKKIFYGCENYPKCDFSCWDKPLKTPCPTCGGIQVQKSFRGKRYTVCLNMECPTNKNRKKRAAAKEKDTVTERRKENG